MPSTILLLELTACGVQVTKKSEHFEDVNSGHEIDILLSCLRRIGHTAPKGVSIRCYTIESKNTATLGLEPPVAKSATTEPAPVVKELFTTEG